tara:strand:+ start:72 stop:233 length:162 start_codon:yes stop_codon:yes gene_type:complete
MCPTLEGVGNSVAKKAIGAPDARADWCKCVTEFGEMVSQEVKTNPRYASMRKI